MLGFIVRFIGCVTLAAAVVVAIRDIARSLSADALRISSLTEVWSLLTSGTGEGGAVGAPAALERWGTLGVSVMGWPAAPALVSLSIVLLIVGRRRAPVRLAR